MKSRCKIIKYYKKRSDRPVVRIKKPIVPVCTCPSKSMNYPAYAGEEMAIPEDCFVRRKLSEPKSSLQLFREWVEKQKFIPQDLSDDFLSFFLSCAHCNLSVAEYQIEEYFYSRQTPCYLFKNRDPLSPHIINIFKKLYVVPMPGSTKDGKKVILTGVKNTSFKYEQLEHAKAFAMVLDLLIWERDVGCGEYVVVFDASNFEAPHLLQNRVPNHQSVTRLLQDSIPCTLRSFYLVNPPPYVVNTARNRNNIWITLVENKEDMSNYISPECLPFEFGGNHSCFKSLLDKWERHLVSTRGFFLNLERRLERDYQRRLCYEKAVAEWGDNWRFRMKLVADESEYKTQYYERMRNRKKIKHPAFGARRIFNKPKEKKPVKHPLDECRRKAKEEKEKDAFYEPTKEYSGYAKEIQRAKREAEREMMERLRSLVPVLELNKIFKINPVISELVQELALTFMKMASEFEGEAGEGMYMSPTYHEKTVEEEKEDKEEGVRKDYYKEPETEEGDVTEEKLDTDSDYDQNLDTEGFKEWLRKEPYLPKKVDDEVINTFLWGSDSLEEAEAKFMNYYYARQTISAVFHDRHPCSPSNLLRYDAVCVVPLTSGLDKKWIIFATWLSHANPINFSIYHMTKLIFAELDILLQENQIRGKTISVIMDLAGFTEEHTKLITRYAAKKICYLFTDCFPTKFNGFYLINPPEHIASYTDLFGSFDFHLVDYLEDLPGFLPKKFLTRDMAGEPTAPDRNDLFEPFFRRLRRCGNWLAYEELVRSEELMLRMTTLREEFSFK